MLQYIAMHAWTSRFHEIYISFNLSDSFQFVALHQLLFNTVLFTTAHYSTLKFYLLSIIGNM